MDVTDYTSAQDLIGLCGKLFNSYFVAILMLLIIPREVSRHNRRRRGWLDVLNGLEEHRYGKQPMPRTYRLTRHFKRPAYWRF